MSDSNGVWNPHKTIGPAFEVLGKHIMGFSGVMGAGALASGGGETLLAHICVFATVFGYALMGLGMFLCKYYGAPDDGVAVAAYRIAPPKEPLPPKTENGIKT